MDIKRNQRDFQGSAATGCIGSPLVAPVRGEAVAWTCRKKRAGLKPALFINIQSAWTSLTEILRLSLSRLLRSCREGLKDRPSVVANHG